MRREIEHVSTLVGTAGVTRTAKTPFGEAMLRREEGILRTAAGRAGAPLILDAQLESSPATLTFQKIPGHSLQQAVVELKKAQLPLPAELAFRWLRASARAIDEWHAQLHRVHGDVSPTNLILDDDRVHLIDFALATDFGQPIRMAGRTLANRGYASPEQLAGHAVFAQSDVFSLAVIASELLCGKRFERASPTNRHISLPRGLSQALLAGLAPELNRRPDSAASFVQALELGACR